MEVVGHKSMSVVPKEDLWDSCFSGPLRAGCWSLGTMAALWVVLLVNLSTLFLGVFIWTVIQHFLTAEIPSALQHPVKFRCMHCIALYLITMVSLLLGETTVFRVLLCDIWSHGESQDCVN